MRGRGGSERSAATVSAGTRNGVLLGAAAGVLAATVGGAVYPALVVCSAAALGALIGARRSQTSPTDVFVLRILLAGCLGALAVVAVGVLSGIPSIAVGLIAVLIVVGAANELIRFRRAERRRIRMRTRDK